MSNWLVPDRPTWAAWLGDPYSGHFEKQGETHGRENEWSEQRNFKDERLDEGGGRRVHRAGRRSVGRLGARQSRGYRQWEQQQPQQRQRHGPRRRPWLHAAERQHRRIVRGFIHE